MNARARIPKSDKIEEKKKMMLDSSKVTNLRNGPKRCLLRREKKITLEQDIDKLRKKLRREENVHRALERAFTRPLGALPRLPPYLPSYIIELLAEVAVLEEEVVRLEDQVMNFRQCLYQEAIYLSSSRKSMENGLDLSLLLTKTNNSEQKNRPSIFLSASMNNRSAYSIRWLNPNLSSNWSTNDKQLPKKLNFSLIEGLMGKENQSNKNSARNLDQSPIKNASRILNSEKVGRENVKRSIHGGLNDKEFKETSRVNKLSEEILRCLLGIFARICLLKNTIAVQSDICLSVSGSCDTSYQDVGFRDPYNICKQFGERDIGPYKLVHEVDSSSSDVNLISKHSFLTRRLKSLVKKLSSVDISELTHQQKLAFWINMYNSCMMIVFVENGIPTTPEMVFALMLKAKVNVGGHSFSAMTIEHFMLRLPYNSKHISPKGLKVGEVTSSMLGLDWPEPLVTFALSCGSWSSPAYR